jgi:hypothetical protein
MLAPVQTVLIITVVPLVPEHGWNECDQLLFTYNLQIYRLVTSAFWIS